MTYDYDLLIVGGGLVGGSLALALKDAPFRVGVVEAVDPAERQASPAGNRALALARGTAQILAGLNVWPAVAPQAMPIRHIHVSDRGRFGKTRLHAADRDVEALGYVAVARVLEDAVEQALAALPCDRLCPARVIGLQAGRDAVCVTLKRGGECLNLTARLVVAADGGQSTVRKLLSIGQDIREYGQTALVTEVRTERDTAHTAYERFTATGPLAFLPLEPHLASVIWTQDDATAEALLALPERAFIARLQAAFGTWLGRIEPAAGRQGFPLRLIQARRMVDERVVLIGNALHQLHPVAGQGFNLGLRDAALLAERLRVQAAFGGDIGDPGGLDRYARARRGDLARAIRFTDGLVRVFSNDFPPLGLARSLALAVLDRLPPAKNLLVRHAMGYGARL
jgi:2-octaprenyl-6-methoxyphenol hydroxylase